MQPKNLEAEDLEHQTMKHTPYTFVALVLSLFATLCATSTSAQAASPPRFALVIGHNKGSHKLKPLRFAQSDAKRFANVLVQLGGFAPKQVKLLLAPRRKQLVQALKQLKAHFKHANGKGMFLLFYSGHADGTKVLLGGEELSFREISKQVKALPVALRVLVIDSCFSGQMVYIKGKRGVRDKGIALKPSVVLKKQLAPLRLTGTAILASSGAQQRSYESDTLQSSFFTSSLIAGLRGAADSNKDSRISLAEAYSYAHSHTILYSRKHGTRIQRPVSRWNLKGEAGSFYLTYLGKAESRITFSSAINGYSFVYRDKKLVEHLNKRKGERVSLGVTQGTYRVEVWKNRWVGIADVSLQPQQSHTLLNTQLKWHKPQGSKTRAMSGDSTGVGFLLSYEGINQLSIHSMGLSMALDLLPWLRMGLTYRLGLWNAEERPDHTHSIGLRIIGGIPILLHRLECWLGIGAEPRLTLRILNESQRTLANVGILFGGWLQLDYELTQYLSLRMTVAAGGHVVFFDQANRISPMLEGAVGLIWNF